jgi:hypothetical protein
MKKGKLLAPGADRTIIFKYVSEKSDLEDVDWIQLARNNVQWWDFVNTMNFRIPY